MGFPTISPKLYYDPNLNILLVIGDASDFTFQQSHFWLAQFYANGTQISYYQSEYTSQAVISGSPFYNARTLFYMALTGDVPGTFYGQIRSYCY
jgi:hypothetical protein